MTAWDDVLARRTELINWRNTTQAQADALLAEIAAGHPRIQIRKNGLIDTDHPYKNIVTITLEFATQEIIVANHQEQSFTDVLTARDAVINAVAVAVINATL